MSVPAPTPISVAEATNNRADTVESRRAEVSKEPHYIANNTKWHLRGNTRILVDQNMPADTPAGKLI